MKIPKIVKFEKKETPEWQDRLQITATGAWRKNLVNAEIFVDALIKNFYLNQMADAILIDGPLPWDDFTQRRMWTDYDNIKLTSLVNHMGLEISDTLVHKAVLSIAYDRRRHPLRDWLKSLKWDRKPRIETWLNYYLAAEDNIYTRTVGRAWLISAVARVMRPGCKVDHMLILEGPEGIRKSTSLKVLAGEEYFTDELSILGSKDASMQINGRWIIEMAELAAMRRPDMPGINAFITRTTDIYRRPYDRMIVEQARQCVFAGTVNPPFSFSSDDDGTRRFWFVTVEKCDSDALKDEREQIWAEAVDEFNRGSIWHIEDEKALIEAKERQENKKIGDSLGNVIDKYLNQRIIEKPNENHQEITRDELMMNALFIPCGQWGRSLETRVGMHLTKRGWKKKRQGEGDNRQHVYELKNSW